MVAAWVSLSGPDARSPVANGVPQAYLVQEGVEYACNAQWDSVTPVRKAPPKGGEPCEGSALRIQGSRWRLGATLRMADVPVEIEQGIDEGRGL